MCHLLRQTMLNSAFNRMDALALVIMWASNLIRGGPNADGLAGLPGMSASPRNGGTPAPAAVAGGAATATQPDMPQEHKYRLALLMIERSHDIFGEPDFWPEPRPPNTYVSFHAKLVGLRGPVAASVLVGSQLWLANHEGSLFVFDVSKGLFSKMHKINTGT
jgi:hypothetical protein